MALVHPQARRPEEHECWNHVFCLFPMASGITWSVCITDHPSTPPSSIQSPLVMQRFHSSSNLDLPTRCKSATPQAVASSMPACVSLSSAPVRPAVSVHCSHTSLFRRQALYILQCRMLRSLVSSSFEESGRKVNINAPRGSNPTQHSAANQAALKTARD